jgi:putative heme transporter
VFRRSAIQASAFLAVAFTAWLLAHARMALFLVSVALLLAVALDVVVRALERRGLARGWGIALVLAGWAAVLAGIVLVFIPPLSGQIGALAESAPQLLDRLRHSDAVQALERHLPAGSILSAVRGRTGQAVSSALAVATGLVGAVAGLVTVYFVVAFMLASGPPLVGAWLSLPSRPRRWRETVRRIHGALAGYVIGVFLIVAVNATLTSTFLGILGVPWFLPLGLFSGLASLVPYVGALAAGLVLAGVAWASNGGWAALATLGYYLVYQQLENHLLAPVVYRRTVSVNPLVILLSALILGEVFGLAGAVLAVPIAASAQIVARELLAARGDGADRPGDERPQRRPPSSGPPPDPGEGSRAPPPH